MKIPTEEKLNDWPDWKKILVLGLIMSFSLILFYYLFLVLGIASAVFMYQLISTLRSML